MKAAASIVVVDARGLTVEQDTVLRQSFVEAKLSIKLLKTQSCVAAEKAGLEDLHLYLLDHLQ